MWPLCDPWYSATSPLPKCPLPGASYSAKLLCGPDTCNLTVAWFPPPSGLMELRIHRWELLTVPIDFMSPCGHSQSWNDWVDKELQDNEFISCLRRANIYNAVLLSRDSDMYRDIQGIKLSQGISYPLGALCLGNLYIHLDRLHDDEVEGSSYHAVESSVNVALLQVFVMEHIRSFASHAKTSKAVRDRVLRSLGDGKGFLSKFSSGFPILFKWVGVKASEVSWMDDLDDEVKFVWRPYVKPLPLPGCRHSKRMVWKPFIIIPTDIPTDIPESAAHSQENDLNMLPQIDTVDFATMLPSNSNLGGAAMDKETNSGRPHIDQATIFQPWDITSSSIPSQANVFTTAIVEKVTDNTRSSEVDLVIQRCGETPYSVSSHLVVGVAALGNTHPCHLNFGLNETRANLRIASHFWSFSEAKENFLHFSILAKAAPLLEKLLSKRGNFMGGFKLGTGFGDFSLALLVAVLMDIHHIPFDLLGEGNLFEWMDAVRDLMTTSVAVGFLLDHIRNLGKMWFAQKEKRK
uniref:Uncharacterized protein n=1 Tax=Fagus sylvatica TaxID=28930 RepID=A0A2N9F0D2_FAGSY